MVVDVVVCSEADALLKEKMDKFSGGANVLSGRVDRKQRKIKRSATIAAPTMSSALNAIDRFMTLLTLLKLSRVKSVMKRRHSR
eukprot:COSAG05_NODE_1860_length_3945_cov_16.773011_3_plen_84_part_00